ncbi:MAG: nucleotidyltransferase family protein [Caldilineaceae bacterium]
MSANVTPFAYNSTPEEELLLCALRSEIDSETAARMQTLVQQGIDWDQLCSLATDHKMVALFLRNLDKVCPSAIPDAFRRELKTQIQINIQGNLFLTKELVTLLNLFSQQKIVAIPYKGPVLAAAVYGDLTLRSFNDLDILVQEADVVRAMELLQVQGYQLIRPLSLAHLAKELQPEQIRKLVANSSWAYQLVMAHSTRKIVVELHWRIVPRYTFAAACAELWENQHPVSIAGATVSTFSPENLLWFLCVHGSKHQWERLSWICDIAQLLHTYPGLDWRWLIDYAKQKGISRRLYLGLLLAHKLLNAPLPQSIQTELAAGPVLQTLARTAIKAISDESDTDSEQSHLSGLPFQVRTMDRNVDRARYVASIVGLLLTPTAEDRNLLRLPSLFSPLYYLVRPLRLGVSYGITSMRRLFTIPNKAL